MKTKLENLTLFCDVSGAFNDLWHDGLLNRLIEIGCPPVYIQLIASFLERRKITFKKDKHEITKFLERSSPQGSVLSPYLWNIFYNQLYLSLKRLDPLANIKLFADDLCVSISCKNRKIAQTRMNKIISRITKWSFDNFISFNAEKTTAVLFSHLRKKNPINLIMNGKPIPLQQSAKYLGITMDRKLTWNEHLTSQAAKCKKLLIRLSCAISTDWGLPQKAMKTIFEMAIEPILLYGASIWIEALEKVKNKTILSRIQRLAALKVTRCLKTTSTDALLVIAGMIPLQLKATERATCTLSRQTNTPEVDRRLDSENAWLNLSVIDKHTSSIELTMKNYHSFPVSYTHLTLPTKA